MNTAEPIRDLKVLQEMKEVLLKKSTRDYVLFCFAINTGLRISDILQLKVEDVKTGVIHLKEEKTRKSKKITLNFDTFELIKKYTLGKKDEQYLFTSVGTNKPISRIAVFKNLNWLSEYIGYNKALSPHSLRKTFGYWHYKKFSDIAILMKIFNHSSPSITLRYIGIDQEEIDNSYKNFTI